VNLGLRSKRPVTNHLKHGMAKTYLIKLVSVIWFTLGLLKVRSKVGLLHDLYCTYSL
jgi:hypothetical protein